MLQAICCYFNPVGYKRRYTNYCEFRKNLNIPLTTIECVFEGQKPAISDAVHVFANKNNLLWQKERLLNILIESLPDCCDKVVWLDVDLVFKNKNWFHETEDKLDDCDVVQPFSFLRRVWGNGSIQNKSLAGFGFVYNLLKIKAGVTGFACSARRDFIPNGLYDRGIVGAGDVMMHSRWAVGMDEKSDEELEELDGVRNWGGIHELWWDDVKNWGNVPNTIGCVDGEIHHLWHGVMRNRNYRSRFDNFCFDFDLERDLTIDDNQLWRTEREDVLRYVDKYFTGRKEDCHGRRTTS